MSAGGPAARHRQRRGRQGRAGGARRASARPRPSSASGLLATRSLVEVRFGGSGGQGVILMGVILAMAGARDHRFVVQTQSYGPEARGGYSRSDVIISDSQIDYPELERADLLVALSQAAADEYVRVLRSDGVLVYDSENVTAVPPFKGEQFGIPFTRLALEETGRTADDEHPHPGGRRGHHRRGDHRVAAQGDAGDGAGRDGGDEQQGSRPRTGARTQREWR